MKAEQRGVKTINLNSDIFTQQSPQRSTIPINLLRSFVQRKRNASSTKSRVIRYSCIQPRNNSRSQDQPDTINQQKLQLPTPTNQKASRHTVYHLKTHTKTNPEAQIRKRHNSINFKEKDPFFRDEIQQPEDLTILRGGEGEEKDENAKHESHMATIEKIGRNYLKEEVSRVNPYTQQEYTYIRHKEKDHLTEIKKTARFRRISSIMQSYKIAPIQLAPQAHRRRPSLEATKYKNYIKGHPKPTKTQNQISKTPGFRRTIEMEVVSPSPWDWGHQPDFSKDFIY